MGAAPLPAVERERVLALLGIDRWVLRTDAAADAGRIAPASRAEPVVAAAASLEKPARAVRLAIATGEPAPLAGRNGPILRHVLRALALDESSVAWQPQEGVRVLAFGAAPGDAADAVLAPPLATLRASGAARRAVWPALRALRRALREER